MHLAEDSDWMQLLTLTITHLPWVWRPTFVELVSVSKKLKLDIDKISAYYRLMLKKNT